MSGTRAAEAAVGAALERIEADGRAGIWITLVEPDAALAAARAVDEQVAAGADLPLAGRTLAVKDNIDVAGFPTTADARPTRTSRRRTRRRSRRCGRPVPSSSARPTS